MQALDLSVRWQDGRTVTVRLKALPLIGSNRRGWGSSAPLNANDVVSRSAFVNWLREATANADDEAIVELAGLETTVVRVLGLLDITGPPPASIPIELP